MQQYHLKYHCPSQSLRTVLSRPLQEWAMENSYSVACNHKLQEDPQQQPVVAVAATEATDRDMQASELVCMQEERLPIYNKFNTTFHTSEPRQCSDREQQAGLLCRQYGRQFAGPHYQPCFTYVHHFCECSAHHAAISVCFCHCCCACSCRRPSARKLHILLQTTADVQVHVSGGVYCLKNEEKKVHVMN